MIKKSIGIIFTLFILLNGCGKIRVASVAGEELGYTKGILVGQGLQVKTVEKEIADVPEGQVLTQIPSPETSIKKGEFVTLTIAKPPLYNLDGNITLIDSKIGGYSDNCYGTGGYSDISSGMSITVIDDKGNIVATGQIGSGNHPENNSYSSVTCIFKFDVRQISKRNFYTFDVNKYFSRVGNILILKSKSVDPIYKEKFIEDLNRFISKVKSVEIDDPTTCETVFSNSDKYAKEKVYLQEIAFQNFATAKDRGDALEKLIIKIFNRIELKDRQIQF